MKILALVLLSISAIAAAETKPKITVEEIFYPGDTLHYWADDHQIGDTITMDIMDNDSRNVLESQNVKVYQYGDHHEIDVVIPKSAKPGYYVIHSRGNGQTTHPLKVVKPS